MPEESALPTEPLGAEIIAEMPAAVAAPDAPAAPAPDGDAPAFSFKDFAQEHGLNKFASLLADAGLAELMQSWCASSFSYQIFFLGFPDGRY